jgi:penicillin amidase
MRTAGKVLGVIGIVMLLLVVGVTTWLVLQVRASFPQTGGALSVPGLASPVQVVRDNWGVPQIYAETSADLYFAQGFVHSQDRFWEMDFRRHITSGRLSEMFGEGQVKTDKVLRTMGWRRVAEREFPKLLPESRANLQAYTRGVNAYLGERPGGAKLSFEYVVLGLTNPDYVVEQWDPIDSLAWLKALAYDLRGNDSDETSRALISEKFGFPQTEVLYPAYPFDRHKPIVMAGEVVNGKFDQNAGPTTVAAQAAALPRGPAVTAAFTAVNAAYRQLETVLGKSGAEIGSNNWVVSGQNTTTGKALLANDPHLAPMMPSIWYQMGLHCVKLSDSCPYDVTGFTFGGMPGCSAATTRTSRGYHEHRPGRGGSIPGEAARRHRNLRRQAEPLRILNTVIKVAGGADVPLKVRESRHGPIMSDVYDEAEATAVSAPVPAPGQDPALAKEPRGDGYAVAMRWTALNPGTTFDAITLLNKARTYEEFRRAADVFVVPAQNLVFADSEGNIAYQTPGEIPIRKGYDGRYPVPGWTSDYDWTGYIPFEALPAVKNPESGWIATANQAVIGPQYQFFLSHDTAYGARSQRIMDLITGKLANGGRISPQDMGSIQLDAWSQAADYLLPYLGSLPVSSQAAQSRALFQGWDLQQSMYSAPAAYFNAVWKSLLKNMFGDRLPAGEGANSGDRWFEVVRNLLQDPDNAWWQTSDGAKGRDAVLTESLNEADVLVRGLLGNDPEKWRWGALHQLTIQNLTLGKSGIAPIEWLSNRGPFDVAGAGSAVNATGWDYTGTISP